MNPPPAQPVNSLSTLLFWVGSILLVIGAALTIQGEPLGFAPAALGGFFIQAGILGGVVFNAMKRHTLWQESRQNDVPPPPPSQRIL